MKKFALSLVFVMAFAGSAFAEVKEFVHMRIDVPAGWETQEEGSAVAIRQADENHVLVLAFPAEGKTAKEIAEAMLAGANGKEFKAEGDGFLFDVEQEGAKVQVYSIVSKDTAVVITMMGSSPDLMKIAKSVVPK